MDIDIDENFDPIDCASLDPMGILFSAQSVLRAAMSEELLAEHGLGFSTREMVATILLLCYKVRSESTFNNSVFTNRTLGIVVSQFLHCNERSLCDARETRKRVVDIEVRLLCQLPMFRLVDETPHASFEWACYRHFEHPRDVHRHAFMTALSAGYFFYHAACLRTDVDMFDVLPTSNVEIGEAIAYVCILGFQLSHASSPASAIPLTTSCRQLHVSALLVQNAYELDLANTPGLRCRATGDDAHACQRIVSHRRLSQLQQLLQLYS
jgi:hypothetical protein